MYRSMPADARASGIAAIHEALETLERACTGPYLCGESITTADIAAFPHFVFMSFMLPRFFAWPDVFAGRTKLERWWSLIQKQPQVQEVCSQSDCARLRGMLAI
jgi:glutathione S-transferase